MSLNPNAAITPSPHLLTDPGALVTPLPATPTEQTEGEPKLSSRPATDSSVVTPKEINATYGPVVVHSEPEKSPRSTSASSVALTNTTDDSLENLKQAALSGDKEAQLKLGCCYAEGKGVDKNLKEAFKWHQSSAELGHVKAQHNLACMYHDGIGVEVNKAKAFEWYEKAAEQGYPEAQCNLGYMYNEGGCVEVNKAKAFELYKKAAEQGQANAQFNLAVMYDEGKGVEENKEKAFEWYKKAALQGQRDSQSCVSEAYQDGIGVSKNFERATYWMMKTWGSDNPVLITPENIQLLEFVPRVLQEYPDLQSVNSLSVSVLFSDDNLSQITKFIQSNSIIKFIIIESEDDFITYSQANKFAKALEFNSQLIELEFDVEGPGKENKNQVEVLLTQNKHIVELRQYVEDLEIQMTHGFPFEVIKNIVDKMIVADLKSGQTKEATKNAIDELLITADMKSLEEDIKIT